MALLQSPVVTYLLYLMCLQLFLFHALLVIRKLAVPVSLSISYAVHF